MRIIYLLTPAFLLISAISFSQKTFSPDSIKSIVVEGVDMKNVSWKAIESALKDVPKNYYKIERVRNNNTNVESNGNAEIKSLKVQKIYAAKGVAGSIATSNMIQVKMKTAAKMSDYIRLVWTADAEVDIKDKVDEVNRLLQKP